MAMLYPALEPYAQGLLDVGDGQHLYWETSGNPQGIPVIALHGGPGSGSRPRMRQFFNPHAYHIILVDQRGCGRSQPHASDPATDLSVNTTWHLVADLERVRQHLGIARWLVFGGSWGSTLAVVYAEHHPEVVTALILWGEAHKRELKPHTLPTSVGGGFRDGAASVDCHTGSGVTDGDMLEPGQHSSGPAPAAARWSN